MDPEEDDQLPPDDDFENDDVGDQTDDEQGGADDGDEPEGVDAPEPEDEDPPVRSRQSRGQRQFGELRKTAREANARAERLERELAEVQRRLSAPPQQDPSALAAERERIANMSWEERLEYEVQRARQDTGRVVQSIQQELRNSQDEAKFERILGSNPAAARFKDEVEKLHQDSVRAGQPVPRTILLELVAGRAALARAPKALKGAQREAGRRIASQTVRRSPSGSDVRGSGRGDPNSLEALERRLRDVTLDKIR